MCRLHKVATDPKEVIDGTMDGEKALDVSQRLKPAHVAFALAGGLMGDFDAVVSVWTGTVMDGGEGSPMGSTIAAEFIGNQSVGDVLQPL
jgi:hypothetical protein